MNAPDDVMGAMREFPIDDRTADALLTGRIVPDDAPPGFEHVAALVLAARGPATAGELAGETGAVTSAMADLPELANATNGGRGRRRMLGQLVSAKVMAAAAVAALGGSAAAAATGSLPGPLQSGVSHGLGHIGISVPVGDDSSDTPAAGPHTTTSSTDSPGPAITAANEFGLCNAFVASGRSTDPDHQGNSRAFAQLAAAAKAKGQTTIAFCAAVTHPGESTTTGSTATGSVRTSTSGHSRKPSGTPEGPPSSTPVGPPSSTPVGPLAGAPVGPPLGHGH
jgi:hypothetical protein